MGAIVDQTDKVVDKTSDYVNDVTDYLGDATKDLSKEAKRIHKDVVDTVKEGAELILLSTNDSWFSDSSAAYMHNNQARFRAVEFSRYIARSANTGLSSFISNTGEVIDELPPLTEDYLCADLINLNSRTLYSRITPSSPLIISPITYAVSPLAVRISSALSTSAAGTTTLIPTPML